jgi:endonuclease/exonuclease/phosphatase family metal-dependent hydrolase
MTGELKIATYNIHDGREPQAVAGTIKSLMAQGISLVCLQEVRTIYRGINIRDVLKKELGSSIQAEYFLGANAEWFDYGLGILWDSEVLTSTSFAHLPLPELPKFKTWEKAFFPLHGLKVAPFKRGALIGTFNLKGKKLRVTNVHLDFHGGHEQRAKQITYLKSYLDSQAPVDYEIICGDFNTLGFFNRTGKAKAIQTLLTNELKSVFAKPYSTIAYQQLDYIFQKGFQTQDSRVHKLSGSDHFPVTATLKF